MPCPAEEVDSQEEVAAEAANGSIGFVFILKYQREDIFHTIMNQIKFKHACKKVIDDVDKKKGIGTLSEKRLHAVLKNYFEPNEEKQEIKVNNYIVDICGDKGIIEIQTRSFNKLRDKLDTFLPINSVTIVYPIPSTKWLIWIDKETGEITDKRKSPKRGTPYEIFFELYKIKQWLKYDNLKVCIVMLDIEEYRYLDGYDHTRKRGSSRCERIPVEIIEEMHIDTKTDYKKLIPADLPEQFSSKDYKKKSRLSLSRAQTALNVLFEVGAVKRVGKVGNLYMYERA